MCAGKGKLHQVLQDLFVSYTVAELISILLYSCELIKHVQLYINNPL